MKDRTDDTTSHTPDTSTPPPRIRRLPAIDCTDRTPVKYVTGPDYPSWLVQPDRPADEHTPAVSNAYLDDLEERRDAESDGLNFARGIGWVLLMAVVGLVLVGVWAACRN